MGQLFGVGCKDWGFATWRNKLPEGAWVPLDRMNRGRELGLGHCSPWWSCGPALCLSYIRRGIVRGN